MHFLKKPIFVLSSIFIFLILGCADTQSKSKSQIIGTYEIVSQDKTKTMAYDISHINDNLYGIKLTATVKGSETKSTYFEGNYNASEKILSLNTGMQRKNLQFSDDFKTISLMGGKKGDVLKRK